MMVAKFLALFGLFVLVSAQTPLRNPVELDDFRALQSNSGKNYNVNQIIRNIFKSFKTGSATTFPTTAQVDANVKLRVVPVGDFAGYNQFKAALYNPFRDSASMFSSVNKVFENYNIFANTSLTDGSVLFLYDIQVDISTRINTAGSRVQNVSIQGTAKIIGGKITHAYFNVLNLDELIKPNYGAYTTTTQNYINFICDNEANKCPTSIFNANNIWWTRLGCMADNTLWIKEIGEWATIGREDSYICRAWYSTMVGGEQGLCQALTFSSDRCKRRLYDNQFPNIGDFYNLAPAAIPRIRPHTAFGPFVTSPPGATTCNAACRAKNVETVERLYSNMLWPQAFVVGHNPAAFDELFSDDVFGRITPVGTFIGKELSREYFAGLTSSNFSSASRGFILQSVATPTFQVIAHILIELDAQPASSFSPLPLSSTNMSEVIVFQFNSQGVIISYDGDLSELGAAQDADNLLKRSPTFKDSALLGDISAAIAGSLNLLQSKTVDGICQAATAFCNAGNDPLGYYTSNQDCKNYLNAKKYGSWDDVSDHDTVTCRLLHTLLVPLRPAIHCPHIGKTGGGKCVTKTMADWYGWKFVGANELQVASTNDGLNTQNDSSSSDNTALIVGLSVGLGLTALLVAGVIGYRYKKNAATTQKEQNNESVVEVKEGRLSVSDGMKMPKTSNLSNI